jgi:hypothetical protein
MYSDRPLVLFTKPAVVIIISLSYSPSKEVCPGIELISMADDKCHRYSCTSVLPVVYKNCVSCEAVIKTYNNITVC